MSNLEIQPDDKKMFQRWHMLTEWLLNRLEKDELKRLVEDIQQATNYKVNNEGNIVEADYTAIDRNKKELQDEWSKKIDVEISFSQYINNKLTELKQEKHEEMSLELERKAKIDALEKTLEVVENE